MDASNSTTSKLCCHCKETKPRADFSPDSRAATGLQPRCKVCANVNKKAKRLERIDEANEKARSYYRNNKEKVLASGAKYRTNHADKVKTRKRAAYQKIKDDPKLKAYRRAYASERKDEKREYDRRYRARREDHLKGLKAVWLVANAEKVKTIKQAYKARRRAWEKDGDSTLAIFLWKSSVAKVCYWCDNPKPAKIHVDHYQPLARGGAHRVANLVIACSVCNQKKNSRDPYEFANSVGRLF